jgi:hypothetical protein
MKRRLLAMAALVGLVVGITVTFAWNAHAQAAMTVPAPEKLLFRVVIDEPIAAADLRSVVPGWRVIVLKDTKTEQCYTTFVSFGAMSKTGPSACP